MPEPSVSAAAPSARAADELDRLLAAGAIGPLDREFARLLGRLTRAPRDGLLAAALASRQIGLGHVCLPLARFEGLRRRLLADGEHGPAVWTPAGAEWIGRLRAWSAVGVPGEYRPLVLDAAGRLYLYRYWRYETELAARLVALARTPVAIDPSALAPQLDRLFPAAAAGGTQPDDQRLACANAALSRLALISGGPGTGKTTTLARLLALLIIGAGNTLRIRLAAPTGKAAARMLEALRGARDALDAQLDHAQRAALPTEAATLHRLLGVRPDSAARFRHDAEHPLALDVLVVDEVSMVDLPLLAKTVAALPAHARLILLGDRDQLASVEAGAVLGELGAQAGPPSPARAAQLAAASGMTVEADPGPLPPLRDCVALLRHSYRFAGDSGIGALAQAVNRGDTDAALARLAAGGADLEWLADDAGAPVLAAALAGYAGYWALLRAGQATPLHLDALHAEFGRFRVLAGTRSGPLGVETLNGRLEAHARRAAGVPDAALWYPGRPVMVLRNDYGLNLYNGDIGIAAPVADGSHSVHVHFPRPDGGYRALPVARLPEHEPVFAMTVHKSQGSEFDAVLLVAPPADSPLATRELLYTGITRTRRRLVLAAGPAAIAVACARRVERDSGLVDRLAEAAAGTLPPTRGSAPGPRMGEAEDD